MEQLIPSYPVFPQSHVNRPAPAIQEPKPTPQSTSQTGETVCQESLCVRIWRAFVQAVQTVVNTILSFLCCWSKPVQKPASNQTQAVSQVQQPRLAPAAPPQQKSNPAIPQQQPEAPATQLQEPPKSEVAKEEPIADQSAGKVYQATLSLEESQRKTRGLNLIAQLWDLEPGALSQDWLDQSLQKEGSFEERLAKVTLPKIAHLQDDHEKMEYRTLRNACHKTAALLNETYVLMFDLRDQKNAKYYLCNLNATPVELRVFTTLKELRDLAPKQPESFQAYTVEAVQND